MKLPPIPFTKMQGLGNDFVVISEALWPNPITPELARKICDRRFGIGADQVLWLRAPKVAGAADVRMEIFNPDGSIAEMCGNGIRAVAIYLRNHGVRPSEETYQVETLAGRLQLTLRGEQVSVNMGQATLGPGTLNGLGESLGLEPTVGPFFEVGMGNPHAVFFLSGAELEACPVETLGPKIEKHPRFPERTNVEFVQVLDDSSIRVRVWERGAGVTLACGTGACAAAVATLATNRVKGGSGAQPRSLTVELPGGRLKISWAGIGQPVLMEGPAKEVFSGQYSIVD